MNFWCIYLGKERVGGCSKMHVYVWELIVSFYYRTTWLMFTKLDRDEGDPGWGKKGQRGWGSLLQIFLSSDWKATATNQMHNQMHNNDLEACEMNCCWHINLAYLQKCLLYSSERSVPLGALVLKKPWPNCFFFSLICNFVSFTFLLRFNNTNR